MITILKLCVVFNFINTILAEHWSQRSELIAKEDAVMLGSSIKIDGIEKCVNKTLMHLKLTELDRGLENPNEFYPSSNFLKTVKYIEASEVYNFIKDIPKGAALHLHDMAMASPEYLYELTFTENLYVCTTKNNRLLLNFFLFHVDNRCEWKPLELAREEEGFEELLQTQLSMDTPAYKKFSNNKVAWTELLGTYATIEGLISYKPIFTSYLTEVLKKMYEDNVMYVELRTTLLPVYDLDGNDYGPSDVVALLKETLADFRCAHNDFLGGKIIYSPSRMVDQSWMDRYVQIVDELSAEHSDFIAGFDLTGQEDLSYPLSRFISSFKEMKSKVHFFFSAGETNWIGAKSDLNLFDAVLLNPTRIGHAFTLFGHPELLKIVKKNDIAIELCPISNQMMMLVSDLRNHPGKFLISHGYPIVVSSDNPGFWGARTLSHDWYMVFMAMADRKADLRLLMQLAINSIKYSTISDKNEAMKIWRKKWNKYMKKMEQWCIENDPDKHESVTKPLHPEEIEEEKVSSNSLLTEDTREPTMVTWTHERDMAISTTEAPTTRTDTRHTPDDVSIPDITTTLTDIATDTEGINSSYSPLTNSVVETLSTTVKSDISSIYNNTHESDTSIVSLDTTLKTEFATPTGENLTEEIPQSTTSAPGLSENTIDKESPIATEVNGTSAEITELVQNSTEAYTTEVNCITDTTTVATEYSTTLKDCVTADATLPDCEDDEYILDTTVATVPTDDCVEYIDDGKLINDTEVSGDSNEKVNSTSSVESTTTTLPVRSSIDVHSTTTVAKETSHIGKSDQNSTVGITVNGNTDTESNNTESENNNTTNNLITSIAVGAENNTIAVVSNSPGVTNTTNLNDTKAIADVSDNIEGTTPNSGMNEGNGTAETNGNNNIEPGVTNNLRNSTNSVENNTTAADSNPGTNAAGDASGVTNFEAGTAGTNSNGSVETNITGEVNNSGKVSDQMENVTSTPDFNGTNVTGTGQVTPNIKEKTVEKTGTEAAAITT